MADHGGGHPEIRRLAVAIDGSTHSTTALDFALGIASGLRARVDVVAVVPTLPEFATYGELTAPLLRRLYADAEARLASTERRVRAGGFACEPFLLEGYPAEQICSFVERERPNLVILGSRGLSDERVHLLGSVSYNVARFARSSVMVARDGRPVTHVLVPVDGSGPAGRATAWAATLAKSLAARVSLLYVIPQETEEVKFTVSRGLGEPFLGPLLDNLKAQGVAAERKVEYGRPAETILRVAREGRFDLIALGVQGRGASPIFALGGVTDRVLHYAASSVLVVR